MRDLASENLESVVDTVRGYALIFVGIGVFSGVMNFITVFFYAIAGEHLTERLRQLLFEKILQLEIAFFDDKRHSTGALCAKTVRRISCSTRGHGSKNRYSITSSRYVFVCLVLALIYEWRVGLVALSFVPVIMVVLYKQGKNDLLRVD
ncbi:unnamed protein product [Arctia plantaginis]|uniref:ABC transmembrane type-1 domain-containing protein n=1 Tax=Arctia plantaginis TaxID=874455 RepID=A0A8S1BD43_ARCPL|nr:unnamed protein product [Arctia plantaginis]